MLMPKKVKYRKQQRGRMAGKAWRGADVSFGDYGLKALEPCWLTDRQIEAARDRKSTRLNSSHGYISYAVFCLKKKKKKSNRSRCVLRRGASSICLSHR